MFRNDLVKAPKRPPQFCEGICSKYGTNVYGEAVWRVVWLPDRVFLNGGYWSEDGIFQYRKTRRYGTKPHWGLERYVPSKAFGDPQSWAEATMNGEGRLCQGAFPQFGTYICTAVFKENLTPTLLAETLRSVVLGDLAGDFTGREIMLAEADEKDRQSDERFDAEWELIDSPRRGLTYTAGGRRVNEHDNLVQRKETEIAAATQGKFREASSGFGQIKNLEELNGGN